MSDGRSPASCARTGLPTSYERKARPASEGRPVKGQERVKDNDVLHVAALANLELTPAEQSRLVTDLNAVLDHIDMLNEVDTANVPPTAAVAGDSTALREDETRPSLPR